MKIEIKSRKAVYVKLIAKAMKLKVRTIEG